MALNTGEYNQLPRELWRHSAPQSTRMYQFEELLTKKYNIPFKDYESLRQWSISNLALFWNEVWQFTGIRASQAFEEVFADTSFIPDLWLLTTPVRF
jgi:acetoacetyl-CoA synthetase